MCVDNKTTTEKRGKGCATHLPLWFLKSPNHAELKSLLWPEETFLGALLRKFKASSSRTYSQLSLSQTKCSKTILLQKCVNTHTHLHLHSFQPLWVTDCFRNASCIYILFISQLLPSNFCLHLIIHRVLQHRIFHTII